MPYSNVWSHVNPLGSVAANTIDEEIRKLRVDIYERMNVLVNDWAADPVVPKTPLGIGSLLVLTGTIANKALLAGSFGSPSYNLIDYADVAITGAFSADDYVLVGLRARIKNPHGAASYPSPNSYLWLSQYSKIDSIYQSAGISSNTAGIDLFIFGAKTTYGSPNSTINVTGVVTSTSSATTCALEFKAYLLKAT